MEQMLAMRLFHLEDSADRLICVRMPSYLLRHSQKYLWFIHHYREAYDLWGTEYSVPQTNEGRAVREFVMRADSMAFAEAKKIYTNSQVISKRLMDFNGIDAQPVYPPILKPEQFYCESYGDYIYYPSRICGHKRQHLAVEAMKYTKTEVKLLISGVVESPPYGEKIADFITSNSLQSKVTVKNEWITEDQKTAYLANCLAVAYVPFDEDSYGYPSLEAHHSAKAVISCTDSGGTDELIVDGENGFLVDSDPKKLAAVFDRLYDDKKLAEKMGHAGIKRINDLDITWDNVIRRFTN
jgi:glycosyltransferase involved in cell wall biosynthesis